MHCSPWQWCCSGPPEDLVIEPVGLCEVSVSCMMRDRDVSSLLPLVAQKNKFLGISTLDIHNSKLSCGGLRRLLGRLQRVSSLRTLNLSRCLSEDTEPLDRGCCLAIATSLSLQPKLRSLNLSSLRLTAAHISMLCPAFALPLEVLDLSGNLIRNAGALRVLRLRHPTLRRLHLHNNEVTREILELAHPLVCAMPCLAVLTVFSTENDRDSLISPEEVERLRAARESREREQERVSQWLRGLPFFRPTLNDSFLCYKAFVGLNIQTGECDFGPDVPEKPRIQWVFPKKELAVAEVRSGQRCIAEAWSGNAGKTTYFLCEVHDTNPLQVRYSSRVVNPFRPEHPEPRAFNRIRRVAEDAAPSSDPSTPSSSTAPVPPLLVSSDSLPRCSSRSTPPFPSALAGSATAPPTQRLSQCLTGRLFWCPAPAQVSFAEQDRGGCGGGAGASSGTWLLDPDEGIRITAELLAKAWEMTAPPPIEGTGTGPVSSIHSLEHDDGNGRHHLLEDEGGKTPASPTLSLSVSE